MFNARLAGPYCVALTKYVVCVRRVEQQQQQQQQPHKAPKVKKSLTPYKAAAKGKTKLLKGNKAPTTL